MPITYRVLGAPGRDNALLVHIDSGQAVERLLFDCGEGCLTELPVADVQAIDHLFFSHFHMDHVAGFDSFFRCNYGRDTKPNRIWGPPESARIVQHRFQGYLWNLHEEMAATWLVADVHPGEVRTTRFELREAFAVAHDVGARPFERNLCEGAGFIVEAIPMEHRTPTLAYVVREKPRHNIDTARLAALGLRPGPWLKQLKDPAVGPGEVVINGATHSLEQLRRELIVESPGDAVAYLTDFLLDEPDLERLIKTLRGCRTVICEGQYRHTDLDLARKNYHMTTVLAATLAQRAGVGELVLFHLSDRYNRAEWTVMLREARQVFPNARYPAHWNLEVGV
jgi:ribonuclease Z